MQPPQDKKPKRKDLWFPGRRYFLRTIRREDASERWAGWLSDPWTIHVLNSVPKQYQKRDIVEYIKQFDYRSKLLLGIFENGTRLLVGFIRVDIDYGAKQALVNAVIGEPDHRNRGATTEVFVPLLDYLFDAVNVDQVKASVLRRNQVTMRYLLKLGWQVDQAAETRVRSTADGTPLAVCTLVYRRDAYRTFRESPLGKRILSSLATAEQRRLRGAQVDERFRPE